MACVCMLSHFSRVQHFATPLDPRSPRGSSIMGFSRQEYWSGLPCPPPGNLLNSGIESASLTSPALAGGFFITSTTWEAPVNGSYVHFDDTFWEKCAQGIRLSKFFQDCRLNCKLR